MPRKARRYECRDSEEKTAEMPTNAEKDKAETKCREGTSQDCETKSKKMSRKARRYSEEKTAGPPNAEKGRTETKCRETSKDCETKSKKKSRKARRDSEKKTAEGPPHAEKDEAETKCRGATSQERETRRPGRLSAISNWWSDLRNRGRRRRNGRVADNEELSPALTEQSTSASPEDLPGPSSASGSKTHALKYTYNSQEDVTTEAASRKEDTRPTTFSEGRHLSFWQKFKRFRKNKVTPFREPEEETSEPRRPVKKSSIKINKVSDEPGFRQEFLCSTIDTSPVPKPEPLPEPPVVISRRRPTNRLAASDVEYHSTLVSVYDKEC
uniref:Serine/arginine repetitive matrix protein 1-like n=1 Tax=Crassostrea virginica TaxID=6565 RepID=A0A8B8EVW8_CRAVI|nr:serine/arginine repetitive matrix protein 1-like [Crassostrea virginica]